MHAIRLSVGCVTLLALGGCATMNHINQTSKQAYKQTDSVVHDKLGQLRPQSKPVPSTLVSTLPYVNTKAVTYEEAYPAQFRQFARLHAPSQTVWSLMQHLERSTGYNVRADDYLLNEFTSQDSFAEGGTDATMSTTSFPRGKKERRHIGAIAYQGPLKGLLDLIAGKLDATWSYGASARSIRFYRYETRVFHIATVPGNASTSTSIGSTSGNRIQGGTGQTLKVAGSGAKAEFSGELSVWKSLKANIEPMLSSHGSLAMSEPTATITVRDRWNRVDQIRQYVHDVNRSLTTQVKVNVTVYRVVHSDEDNRGFNWSLLYDALGQASTQFGVNIATPRPSADGLSSLILTAPKTKSNGSLTPFSGSKFFLDALSSLGRTSVVQHKTVSTVNNVPASVKVFLSKAYLAQTTSLLTSGVSAGNSQTVGAGATLTPGSVETGFSMQFLPSVQADGHRILLQIRLSMSSLDDLSPVESGGQMIQLPTVSGRQFMQRVWLQSGQSLILAGYEDNQAGRTTNTPFSEQLWALGGNRSVSTEADALVIVITPVATSHQRAI